MTPLPFRSNRFRMWRVQAQLACTTLDGWQSSRQVRTMDMACPSARDAATAVSHAAWDASGPVVQDTRRTYASVVEIDHYGHPIGDPVWISVAYVGSTITVTPAASYAALKRLEEMADGRD